MENLKAFSILLLFAWHSAISNTTFFAISFMMPIFAFMSGYSTKNVNCQDYTKKIFSMFVLAHFIIPFTSRDLFRDYEKLMYWDELVNFFLFKPNLGILWYLLALIPWVYTGKLLLKTKYPFIFSLVISTALILLIYFGVNTENSGYGNTYNLYNATKFFPMYMLGVTFEWKTIIQIRYSIFWRIVLGFLTLAVAIMYGKNLQLHISTNALFITISHMFFSIISLFGFLALFPGMLIRTFTNIGGATLNIYILHMFFISVFNLIVFKLFGFDFAVFKSMGAISTMLHPITWINIVYIYLVSVLFSQESFMKLILVPSNYIEHIIFGTPLPEKDLD